MARTRTQKGTEKTGKTEAQMIEAAGLVPVEETASEQPVVEETPVDEQPKERKLREVGPATQKVIDQIKAMYEDEGLGFPSIAKRLNEQNVPTFRGGETWHPPVVRNIVIRHGWSKGEKAKKEAAPSEA
jgi:hypothetical protein